MYLDIKCCIITIQHRPIWVRGQNLYNQIPQESITTPFPGRVENSAAAFPDIYQGINTETTVYSSKTRTNSSSGIINRNSNLHKKKQSGPKFFILSKSSQSFFCEFF